MEKMPHIQLSADLGVKGAVLPGDPARVGRIARYLEDVKEETFNREYRSITGTYKGVRLLAMSTGMGGASTSIGAEELADIGVTHVIRIGSCGALQKGLSLGDLVICEKAVCDDGASQSYMGTFRFAAADWPEQQAATERIRQKAEADGIVYAYADQELAALCEAAAKDLAFPYAMGSTRCHDALYIQDKLGSDQFYSRKGITASDMETAALFAVAARRGLHACSILNVVVEWEQDTKEGIASYSGGADMTAEGEKREILTALEALRRAIN